MANGRELSVLVSVAERTKNKMDRMTEEEKERFREQVCRKASQSLSMYYSAHRDEWEEFIKKTL